METKEYFSPITEYNRDAAALGAELERLALSGRSTAADIVAAATSKDSPLHAHVFHCDPDKAAHLYYCSQARRVASAIYVRSLGADGVVHEVRAFHAVTITAKQSPFHAGMKQYVTIAEVKERIDYRTEVVGEAKKQALSWRERYADYEDVFADVFAAIDRLRDTDEAKAA